MPIYVNISDRILVATDMYTDLPTAVRPGEALASLDKLDLLNPGLWSMDQAEPRVDPRREVEAVSGDETTAVVLELPRRDLDRVLLSAEVFLGGPATGVLEVYVRPHGQEAWHGTTLTIDLAAPAPVVIDAPVSAIRLQPSDVSSGARFRAVARQF